jgi:hypothetical protein
VVARTEAGAAQPAAGAAQPAARAGPSAAPQANVAEDAARTEMMALLSSSGVGDGLTAMQDALRDLEDPEELARREMLLLGSSLDAHAIGSFFSAAAELIDPEISVDLCIDRGWPANCFTACVCVSRCMKRLAMQHGDVFDDLLRRLREARTRAEADAELPRAKRAQQILQGSTWRHSVEGVASPMLEALLVDERAAAAELEARAKEGSLEAVVLAVNAVLLQNGCCKQGRLAFLECSANYLSYDRRRGGARASTSREKGRVPIRSARRVCVCSIGYDPLAWGGAFRQDLRNATLI